MTLPPPLPTPGVLWIVGAACVKGESAREGGGLASTRHSLLTAEPFD